MPGRTSRELALLRRRDRWEGSQVPGGVAPRALPGVLALIIVLAIAVVPVVDARPKDRINKQDKVAEETVPSEESGQSRSEEHTSELQSRQYLVCRLLLEK